VKGNYHVIDRIGKKSRASPGCLLQGQWADPAAAGGVNRASPPEGQHCARAGQPADHRNDPGTQRCASRGTAHAGTRPRRDRLARSQAGRVSLEERKVGVRRPRLRLKGKGRGGEVEIPAYQALAKNPAMCARMFRRCCAVFRPGNTATYCRAWPRPWGIEVGSQRKSDRSQRGATGRVAGDLHRRDAVRRASRDQRGGRGFERQQECARPAARVDGEHVCGEALLVHLREQG
jgi:hypothetical protein